MNKTSVYLTDEMQKDLAKLSKKTGVPQSGLIRQAIAALLKKVKE